MPCRVLLAALSIAAFGCGCSITEQFSDGELVARSVRIGPDHGPSCDTGATRIHGTTFGIQFASQSADLGIVAYDQICLPVETCTAIFFVDGADQADAILAQHPELTSACIIPKRSI